MKKIILDILSGDLPQVEAINAAIDFVKDFDDAQILLIGEKNDVKLENDRLSFFEANKKMPMDIGAMDALRQKETSMFVSCLKMLELDGDALVSAGGTGALLTLASVKLKKIPSVLRPALISPVPTKNPDKKVILLDLGASNENTPEELVQFAKMARIYAMKAFNNKNPKTYLLSNGSEDHKGSPTSKAAFELLKHTNFEGFMGNIEARDVLSGDNDIDIVVCDGFNGNVFLKASEGTVNVFKESLKTMFKTNLKTKIGYLLVKKELKNMSNKLSSKTTGGAMFIGLNKVVIKAHGSSDRLAFYNAIKVAYNCAKGEVVSLIKEGLEDE